MEDNITFWPDDDENMTTEAIPITPDPARVAYLEWRAAFILKINKAKTPLEAKIAINAILMFLIIVGNVWVIIAVIRQPKLRNSATNIFIVSLSISDLIIGVVFVPMQTADYAFGRKMTDPYLCFFTSFLHSAAQCGTSLSLICIAIDRYRAIVTPLKPKMTPQQALIGCGVVWFLCCAFSVQVYLNRGIEPHREVCGTINEEADKWMRVEYAIVLYLIPLIIIAVLYLIMIKTLWCSKSPSNSSNRNKKKAVKMLSFVVIQFALTWAPYWFWQIYVNHENNPPRIPVLYTDTLPSLFSQIFYCNSFINPILYAYFNENFRKEFVRLFPCLVRKAKVSPQTDTAKDKTADTNTNTNTNSTQVSTINSTAT
ncbi:neuropeptide FF receptor 2-like [Glandiceps talaboti]